MKKNILYIGRFQPFHKGHSDAIDQIFEKFPDAKIFIGIGSAEDNFTKENPLTAGERFEIIERAMEEKNIPAQKYAIVPIRNINHYALWPYHVLQYLPQIDITFSGSPLVRQLWNSSGAGLEVFELEKRFDVSASAIRQMVLNEQDVSDVLLSSTAEFLQQMSFFLRLKNMNTF